MSRVEMSKSERWGWHVEVHKFDSGFLESWQTFTLKLHYEANLRGVKRRALEIDPK